MPNSAVLPLGVTVFDIQRLIDETTDLKAAYDAQKAAKVEADTANAVAAEKNAAYAAADATLKSEVDFITALVAGDPSAVDPTPPVPVTTTTAAPEL